MPVFLRLLFLATVLLTCVLSSSFAQAEFTAEGFAKWTQDFKQRAISEGIKPELAEKALSGLRLNTRVVELDRNQPEVRQTYQMYTNRVISEARVQTGKRLLQENRALLNEVSRKYGVQPRFIVALWGIESDFGRLTGGYPVVESLANLAYEGRRQEFFSAELIHALRIVQDGHIQLDSMLGSWAGAMGQTQFMPSSFLNFAVDYDGDGRKDIWGTRADVFASIANYLKNSGWDAQRTWGREVRLPADFDVALASRDNRQPLSEWQRLGVRQLKGQDLPRVAIDGRIVIPDADTTKPAFLVYGNYDAILRWNRSNLFALAVGHLSDRFNE